MRHSVVLAWAISHKHSAFLIPPKAVAGAPVSPMARQALQSDPASKRLFSHKPVVAGLVRLLGDDWVGDLDLDRLERLPTEYVSDDLCARRADLPWWVPSSPPRDGPPALARCSTSRGRAFAIETGQIEGLYTLKAGITEQLVAEGLEGVVRSHTVENVEDRTIKGLLADQETAYAMLFEDIASGRPLTQHAVLSWHQLVTRHQETVAGLTVDGRRVQAPFRRKGMWKNRPNKPALPGRHDARILPAGGGAGRDGPLLRPARGDRGRRLPGVRGGRVDAPPLRVHAPVPGRQRAGVADAHGVFLHPPRRAAAGRHGSGRPGYINALEVANGGDLRTFSDYIGTLALVTLREAVILGRRALAGNVNRPNGNGGRTIGTTYLPPVEGEGR